MVNLNTYTKLLKTKKQSNPARLAHHLPATPVYFEGDDQGAGGRVAVPLVVASSWRGSKLY
jgi:hypothetical protein